MLSEIRGQSEIHLFFETIHLGDSDLHLVAEPEHTPIASANELVSLNIKNVKIINQAGNMHQTAHCQSGPVSWLFLCIGARSLIQSSHAKGPERASL